MADEAAPDLPAQGLPASIVLTTSANAVVAKKGSLAYDTSKAAANHLVRELAVELAPLVRVNAVAPATVVKGSAMFPRDRVIASLAKYGIAFGDDEPTEALREQAGGVLRHAVAHAARSSPRTRRRRSLLLVSGASPRPPGTSSRSTAGCRTDFCGEAVVHSRAVGRSDAMAARFGIDDERIASANREAPGRR